MTSRESRLTGVTLTRRRSTTHQAMTGDRAQPRHSHRLGRATCEPFAGGANFTERGALGICVTGTVLR